MKIVLMLLILVGCAYQIVATLLARDFSRRRPRESKAYPRFSQVKPLKEVAPASLESIESFLVLPEQQERDFYICSRHPVPEEWVSRWDQVTWLRLKAEQGGNGKAATLALGQRYWSGDIFVISDADMVCDEQYLQAVLGEFEDPEVGAVTCLYRGIGGSGPGSVLESLCILDFSSSVLVAEKTEGVKFAMGSTMAVRREVLEQVGGFESLAEYLADDFQLGYRAAKKGWKVALAPTVLDTDLGAPGWRDALQHQYRWMVTSRVSRPLGHAAFIVTQGLPWSLLLILWDAHLGAAMALFWCFLRIALGAVQNASLKGVRGGSGLFELLFLPLKDLVFIWLWAASLRGNKVQWGDESIEVDSEGRIL